MQTLNRCLLCSKSRLKKLASFPADEFRKALVETRNAPVDIVMCRGCGFLFQNPRFGKLELESIYTDIYRSFAQPSEEYLAYCRKRSADEFTWIRSRFPAGHDGSSKKVIEIGCASGMLLKLFKESGWRVKGFEPTQKLACWAQETLGLDIEAGYFSAAVPESYDLAVLSAVLEHVLDPETLLRDIQASLKPSGMLYLSVPNYRGWKRKYQELFGSTHLWFFTGTNLAHLLERCGFCIVSLDEATPQLRVLAQKAASAGRPYQGENSAAVAWGFRLKRLYLFISIELYGHLSAAGKNTVRFFFKDAGLNRLLALKRRYTRG